MEAEDLPLNSVVIVNDEAYVSQLPMDGSDTCNFVKFANKLGIVAKTKERMMGAMLLDADRNEKYKLAIQQVVKRGDIVLDAGSGTGLLSLLAAQAGASTVWASEMNEVFSELSQQVVNDNPEFEPVVECIAMRTTDFALEEEDRVDVIITETMDSVLTTEGMIGTIKDARKRLGKPGSACRTIPSSGKIFGRLVELRGALLDQIQVGDEPLLIHADCPRVRECLRQVSKHDLQVFALNFDEEEDLIAELRFERVPELGEQQQYAVLCWWETELAPGIVISTNPDTQQWQDHWHHSLFRVELEEEKEQLDAAVVRVKLDVVSGRMSILPCKTNNNKRAKCESIRAQQQQHHRARWSSKAIELPEALLHLLEKSGLNEIDAALLHLFRTAAAPNSGSAVHFPKSASVRCTSVQFADLKNPRLHLAEICGFNHKAIIRAWNSVEDMPFSLALFNYAFTIASEPITLATLDYEHGALALSDANAKLELTLHDRANALLFWVEWEEEEHNIDLLLHPSAQTQVMFLPSEHAYNKEHGISLAAKLDEITNRLSFKVL